MICFSNSAFIQDDAAARAAQAFVVVVGEKSACGTGFRVDARGDQAGLVRHVDHQIGANRLRDLRQTLEIDAQREGRCAGDEQLGLVFPASFFGGVGNRCLPLRSAVAHDVTTCPTC